MMLIVSLGDGQTVISSKGVTAHVSPVRGGK